MLLEIAEGCRITVVLSLTFCYYNINRKLPHCLILKLCSAVITQSLMTMQRHRGRWTTRFSK